VVAYSDDAASRDRVGEIEIRRGELSPALEEAAFALTGSDPYSTVIEDAAGVHLLKFVRYDEAADTVVAQHILISADRRALAESLWAQVQTSPDSFASIATASSEDPDTASGGGDLGWITKDGGQLSPLVEASAFALTQTNAISVPILDEEGYHILQLVQRDDANNQVRVRQILIRNGAGLAQQILDDVRAGTKDFSQAVVDYSEDRASLDKAGDIGWVTRTDRLLPTDVISGAFALSPTGSLTAIIETPDAYYIAQLVERDDANNRRHLRIILIKRAEVLLQEIRDYIVGGDAETRVARFMEMALKYSDDSESNTKGGDLGWFGRGKTANTIEIEDQAFAMQPDEISEVFEGASGWHLVWVRDHDMNHPIDQETLDQRAQERYDAWKANLVEQATVVRYPAPTPTPTPTPPPFVPTLVPTEEPTTEPVTGTVTP
jgi:parvulin-like peptidyl-prolyl isomerase